MRGEERRGEPGDVAGMEAAIRRNLFLILIPLDQKKLIN